MQKDNSDSWYQQMEDIRLLSILSLEMSIPSQQESEVFTKSRKGWW